MQIRTSLMVALVLCLVAPANAQRPNSWAARSSSGQTFGGTWTVASEDEKTGSVTGTWTLLDGQGRTVAAGGWGASKSPTGWTGNWRAVVSGRAGEYSGTWSATLDLKGSGWFSEMFAKAAEAAVSGTWRAAGQSGSWTIQVFK